MTAALTLAAIVAATLLSIVTHELGHYFAARLIRWPVRAFAIGFEPTLFTHQDRAGTAWRFRLLPLGGYVILRPDPPAAIRSTRGATLLRMTILAAGPGANLLLAGALYAGTALLAGIPTYLPVASTIEAGSPAERAGFRDGDRIVAVDGRPVATFDELRPMLRAHPGQRVPFSVDRAGRALTIAATLAAIDEHGSRVGHLGIWSHATTDRRVGALGALGVGASETWQAVADTASVPLNAMRGERTSSRVPGLANPLELARQAAKPDAPGEAALAALLSVEMALLNLLPLPMLDGGALLIAAAQLRRGGRGRAAGIDAGGKRE